MQTDPLLFSIPFRIVILEGLVYSSLFCQKRKRKIIHRPFFCLFIHLSIFCLLWKTNTSIIVILRSSGFVLGVGLITLRMSGKGCESTLLVRRHQRPLGALQSLAPCLISLSGCRVNSAWLWCRSVQGGGQWRLSLFIVALVHVSRPCLTYCCVNFPLTSFSPSSFSFSTLSKYGSTNTDPSHSTC